MACVVRLLLLAAFCFGVPGVENKALAQATFNQPYPLAASKKGLQVEDTADALALGIKHATLNLDLCRLIAPSVTSPADNSSLAGRESAEQGVAAQVASTYELKGASWNMDGKTYHFHKPYLNQLDRDVKRLSDADGLVSVILLAYQHHDAVVNEILIHPACVEHPPNRLGAFNNRTERGRDWLRATIQFLSNRWSQPNRTHGRVVGWIVGNEVNSHWWWANMSRVSMEAFAADYAEVVRIVHEAVRSQSATDRVYVSLEHHWNIRYPAGDEKQAFAARPFLEHFAALVREGGDFDWHVAFHPYPENLFDPAFWLDESATDQADSPRVTFKNLPVLLAFLDRAEMRFEGQVRRVILSEQGFHSDRGEQAELIQAAAYCYAYRLVESIDGIDAFILHRHIDHPREGGLNLGLRRSGEDGKHPAKPIYECFRAADTPQWRSVFEFALPLVGLETWP